MKNLNSKQIIIIDGGCSKYNKSPLSNLGSGILIVCGWTNNDPRPTKLPHFNLESLGL